MGSLPRLAPATLWLWSAVAVAGEVTRTEPLSTLQRLVGHAVDLLLLIAVLVIGYAIVACRRRGVVTGFWSWLIVPLVLLAMRVGFGYPENGSSRGTEEPLQVRVTGHQGWWEFEYGGDVRLTSFGKAHGHPAENHLILPAGRPVRIIETSADVVHPFVVPALGIRNEAMPGYFTEALITPKAEGLFQAECRGCGAVSPAQLVVEVVSERQFEAWKKRRSEASGRSSATPKSNPASVHQAEARTGERRATGAR